MPTIDIRSPMRAADGTLYRPGFNVEVAEEHLREFGWNNRHGALILPDARDTLYPAAMLHPAATGAGDADADEAEHRGWRSWWTGGWWGDQGYTPQCVAYAWLHALEDGPVTHEPRTPGAAPLMAPKDLYRRAQQIDEWPGESYAGTSIRAGAKALQERGLIGEYRWLWTLEEIVHALLTLGPIVVATPWHAGMEQPDENGYISITGQLLGWHATVWNGVNRNDEDIRGKNSWGRRWGDKGFYRLRFQDVETLIRAGSQFCIATERGA